MQFLVQMKLVAQARPASPEAGATFFNGYIRPTLELGRKLMDQKKILAGGPISGAIGLALIVNADSPRELDEVLTSLPVWPFMEVEVTPLTTFEDRAQTIQRRLGSSREPA